MKKHQSTIEVVVKTVPLQPNNILLGQTDKRTICTVQKDTHHCLKAGNTYIGEGSRD